MENNNDGGMNKLFTYTRAFADLIYGTKFGMFNPRIEFDKQTEIWTIGLFFTYGLVIEKSDKNPIQREQENFTSPENQKLRFSSMIER